MKWNYSDRFYFVTHPQNRNDYGLLATEVMDIECLLTMGLVLPLVKLLHRVNWILHLFYLFCIKYGWIYLVSPLDIRSCGHMRHQAFGKISLKWFWWLSFHCSQTHPVTDARQWNKSSSGFLLCFNHICCNITVSLCCCCGYNQNWASQITSILTWSFSATPTETQIVLSVHGHEMSNLHYDVYINMFPSCRKGDTQDFSIKLI